MYFTSKESVLASGIVYLILNVIVVIARFALRWKARAIGLDDWFCVPSLVFSVALHIIVIEGAVTNTIGGHEAQGPEKSRYASNDEDILVLARLNNLECIFEPLALASIKISLLLFYRRIFIARVVHYISWILIALTAAWGLSYAIFQIAACWTQIRENFNNGDCPWIYGPGYVYVAVDVFVDTAILIIPMALVFNMLVPWRRKVAILGAILVGSLAIAYAYVRMVATWVDIGIYDRNTRQTLLLLLPAGQAGLGLIAICLPILGPTFVRYFGQIFGRFPKVWQANPSSLSATEPLTAEPKPEMNKSTTLGSINTQDIEAYARGRVYGDTDQIMQNGAEMDNRNEFDSASTQPVTMKSLS